MKNASLLTLFFICSNLFSFAQEKISLEQCQQLARKNYPIVKQFNLIDKTTDYSISNAKRAYIPKLNLYANVSYYSAVTEFPDEMQKIYQQAGITLNGLNKDQYKIAAELNQTIYDGGIYSVQKAQSLKESELNYSNIEIKLYELRERINSIYFSILILNEQLSNNNEFEVMLNNNLNKLSAHYKNGTATASDCDLIKASILKSHQDKTVIISSLEAYLKILSIFTGLDIKQSDTLILPEVSGRSISEISRPEISQMEIQSALLEIKKKELNTKVTPKLSLYANGYYGNPGFNLFKDMVQNRWTMNYMAGIRLQLNFGAYNTKRNDMQKINLSQATINNNKEVFLFNTNLQSIEQEKVIDKYEKILKDDTEIEKLRESIRIVEESKLDNGIIDITNLLDKITDENYAHIATSIHKIELIKALYDLKHINGDDK